MISLIFTVSLFSGSNHSNCTKLIKEVFISRFGSNIVTIDVEYPQLIITSTDKK